MKNLITSVACVMILLAFVVQFTQNQVIHNKITAIDQHINSFKEICKQEGCITDENEEWLKAHIAVAAGCRPSEIDVSGTKTPVYRGEKIKYSVEVPIKSIIGDGMFWNIDDEENMVNYRTERFTTSEFIGR